MYRLWPCLTGWLTYLCVCLYTFSLPLCLSICPSVCPSVRLSVCLLFSLYVFLSVCLYVCLLLSVWLILDKTISMLDSLSRSFTRSRSATSERKWMYSPRTPGPVMQMSLWQAFGTNWIRWSEQSEGAKAPTCPLSNNLSLKVTPISAWRFTQSSQTSKRLFVVSSTPAVRKRRRIRDKRRSNHKRRNRNERRIRERWRPPNQRGLRN